MKHIFITGISGLLGTNLAHHLLEQGYKVTGLVRKTSSYKGKAHANLKLIEGELFGNFLPIFKQMDAIVHVAAATTQNITKYGYYHKINCESTIQLFQAARLSDVQKFVFVSTANTIGNGPLYNPGHEERAASYPYSESLYAKSKREAESYLLSSKTEMDISIVNPTFMLGAFDSKPSSGKIITRALQKRLVLYPPGGKNFVNVKDVCIAIEKCLTNSAKRQQFVIANANLSYKQFYQKLNTITHQERKLIEIPKTALKFAGIIGDLLRFFKVQTQLSSVNMKMLYAHNYYSNKKSVQELNTTYRPIETAIIDAVDYFNQNQNLR